MNDSEVYKRRLFAGGSTDFTTGSVHSSDSSPRVARPARRRSRASRRAPTTILNTDTANFRAMVQQFTGIPSAPSYTATGSFHHTSGSPAAQPPVIDFSRYVQPLPPSSQPYQPVAPPPMQQYHQLFQPQQQQQQQQLFSLGENPNDVFLSSGFAGNSNSDQGIFYEDGISGQIGNRSAPAAGDHRSDTYYL